MSPFVVSPESVGSATPWGEVCGLCLQEEKGSCPPCPVAVWNPAK